MIRVFTKIFKHFYIFVPPLFFDTGSHCVGVGLTV